LATRRSGFIRAPAPITGADRTRGFEYQLSQRAIEWKFKEVNSILSQSLIVNCYWIAII
jgi:hypothetical protein